MPVALTYPGVYVEEIPSGVRTIVGVATSVTAFIGRSTKGPVNKAVDIFEGDFERIFGGLAADSPVSFAVRDFFANGGQHGVMVRLFHPTFPAPTDNNNPRQDATAAAKEITDAAAAKTTGKEAKEAAAAKLAEINARPAATDAAKQAAKAAADVISMLTDTADAAAIGDAVKLATATAVPSDVRSLIIGPLHFQAASEGRWGGYLRIWITAPTGTAAQQAAAGMGLQVSDLFNLMVTDAQSGTSESYLNLTVKKSSRRVDKVLANSSSLISWAGPDLDQTVPALPDLTHGAGDELGTAYQAVVAARNADPPNPNNIKAAQDAYDKLLKLTLAGLSDGGALTDADFLAGGIGSKRGIYALEQLYAADGIFNLLCIPPYNPNDVGSQVVAAATDYCETRRAMLLLDPPSSWTTVAEVQTEFGGGSDSLGVRSRNAAVFFPRLSMANPLHENQIEPFPPCGAVAGIFARTDTQRGVWKSPAGLDANLVGVSALSVPMTDDDNGRLNPLGINCLRSFPVYGRVVWGSRTMRGADGFADEYKYIAVRRTALFIEESLYRALKWVVFEPNAEPLWAQIRLNVGAFMHNLFRQGAFQGQTAQEAYFVRCDASTTTQNDINLGIVNIIVGFAPLKPAEFVVIKLQQIAGQIET